MEEEVQKHFSHVHITLVVPRHQTLNRLSHSGESEVGAPHNIVQTTTRTVVNYAYIVCPFWDIEIVQQTFCLPRLYVSFLANRLDLELNLISVLGRFWFGLRPYKPSEAAHQKMTLSIPYLSLIPALPIPEEGGGSIRPFPPRAKVVGVISAHGSCRSANPVLRYLY